MPLFGLGLHSLNERNNRTWLGGSHYCEVSVVNNFRLNVQLVLRLFSFPVFRHAGSRFVSWPITLLLTEISQRLLDGLPSHFAQTFMVPRG